jgi:oligopeptide transport system permease protein
MLSYALRRLLGALPTLLVIVTLAFALMRLAPGGPFTQEQQLPPEVRANLDAAYGLDRPLPEQFAAYLGGLLRGDFGPSLRYRDFSVGELIREGLPVTLQLAALALLLAVPAGVALGVTAAAWAGGWLDRTVSLVTLLGVAIPAFVLAPLLALVFGLRLEWLPVGGYEPGQPSFLVLPALTLALPLLAYVARLTRGSLLESLESPWVRTARAKGLAPARVLWVHALPPALLPVVSLLGPATASLLTGSLVVEQAFSLPGIGRHFVQGALNRDYTLVMGMVIFYAAAVLLLNLLVDLVYGWLDPRIRRG